MISKEQKNEASELTVGDMDFSRDKEGNLIMKEKNWIEILLADGWKPVEAKGYLKKQKGQKLIFSKMSKL